MVTVDTVMYVASVFRIKYVLQYTEAAQDRITTYNEEVGAMRQRLSRLLLDIPNFKIQCTRRPCPFSPLTHL